ncbi:MAG: ATP-binding cassette domain-containing protein [Armatimonadetes bacterium]|nr:ATP-binding cassette domain-containing protein [Armatimonadota bacterium]
MSILLEQVTKRYEGHPVVNRVTLEIREGEFFVLIGPSGSGKSTVLRMIAGLNTVDEGRIWLHGNDVTHLPPQRRGVGFVFQHYALFRHMTVADNVEFALRVRRVPKQERRRRRDELLELVGLAGLGGRLPSQLSGGQQQRVALARAVAHSPRVLLLDEPFGALDAKIRVDLRQALRKIQQELGLTAIFVTHDQEEAFELADRLGVMNFGRLLEVGVPSELYQRPQTEFVSAFLGTANLFTGQCTAGEVQVGAVCFNLHTDPVGLDQTQRLQVLVRPEDVALSSDQGALDGQLLGQGTVHQCIFSGSFERLKVRLPLVPGLRPTPNSVAFGEDPLSIEATRTVDQARALPLHPGDAAWVGVRRIHALAHPGLRLLMISDGSSLSEAAIELGGTLARLAYARVTLLGCAQDSEALAAHLHKARERLGSGLAGLQVRAAPGIDVIGAVAAETERQEYDLIVLGFKPTEGLELAQRVLEAGEHHLLLVPGPQKTPTRVLICVAGGEPSKEDVLFAGRVAQHLGAEASLLSVVPPEGYEADQKERARRFVRDGERTLTLLGVPAQARLETGRLSECILAHMQEHDLLVLGTPLPERRRGSNGQLPFRNLSRILSETRCATLLVRSRYVGTTVAPLTSEGRINIVEEILVQ